MSLLHRDEWGDVLTEDGEHLLVTGLSLSMGRLGRFEANQNTDRLVACWNACDGLTDDQVKAIRRLVTWWTTLESADIREVHDEMVKLEEVFPQVRAGE